MQTDENASKQAEAKAAEAAEAENENENKINELAKKVVKTTILLAIKEKELQTLNDELQKVKTPTVKFTLTDKNKTIVFSKKAIELLTENGVNISKNYYSYNATPSVYDALEKLVNANKDKFTIINK